MGWCTVWWNRLLSNMVMLGQCLRVPRNFEIFYDRLGSGRWNWRNHITSWNLVTWATWHLKSPTTGLLGERLLHSDSKAPYLWSIMWRNQQPPVDAPPRTPVMRLTFHIMIPPCVLAIYGTPWWYQVINVELSELLGKRANILWMVGMWCSL